MNDKPIWIDYTNHRGERRWRHIEPRRIYWGSTVWHPHPQWLMHAFDVEKVHDRDFALSSIHAWSAEAPANRWDERADDGWPRLDRPAMVGSGRFMPHVSARLVVMAAQRLYESEVTPEKEAQRIAAGEAAMQAFRAEIGLDAEAAGLAACVTCGAPAGVHAEPYRWSGRVVEVCYETHRAVVRYEGLHPKIGIDVAVLAPAGDAGMPVVAQASTAIQLRNGRPPELFWFGAGGRLQPGDYLVSQRDAQAAIAALYARIAELESGWKDRASADVGVLLAEYHSEVWAAATAAEDGRPPVDYDIAGVETAKKIVAAAHARDAEVAAMRERVEFHVAMTRDAQEVAAAARKRVRELEVALQSVMDAHCKYSQAPDDNDSKEWEALKAAHASSRDMLKRAGAASPPVAGGR